MEPLMSTANMITGNASASTDGANGDDADCDGDGLSVRGARSRTYLSYALPTLTSAPANTVFVVVEESMMADASLLSMTFPALRQKSQRHAIAPPSSGCNFEAKLLVSPPQILHKGGVERMAGKPFPPLSSSFSAVIVASRTILPQRTIAELIVARGKVRTMPPASALGVAALGVGVCASVVASVVASALVAS